MGCVADNNGETKVWQFVAMNGNTGEMVITDQLLDTEERAEERAEAELLENGYISNGFTFPTYRTDLKMLDIINIGGLPYKIIAISANVDPQKLVLSITVKRYD